MKRPKLLKAAVHRMKHCGQRGGLTGPLEVPLGSCLRKARERDTGSMFRPRSCITVGHTIYPVRILRPTGGSGVLIRQDCSK